MPENFKKANDAISAPNSRLQVKDVTDEVRLCIR